MIQIWCPSGPSPSPPPPPMRVRADLQQIESEAYLFTRDISRFFPRIDRIFFWKALNPFFGAQDEGFLEIRSR